MAVSIEELENSPRIKVSPDSVVGTRDFKIAWGDITNFTIELVGGYRAVGSSFVYTSPATFPGVNAMVCEDVDIQPFDKKPNAVSVSVSGAFNTHGYALVTATYRATLDSGNAPRRDANPTVPTGTFLRWRQREMADYLTIPGRTWYWDAAIDTVLANDINPGVLLPTTEHLLEWSKVPLPPFSTIRALKGKVNSVAFLGAQAETILFVDADIETVYQIDGNRIYTLTYHFLEQSKHGTTGTAPTNIKGWNHLYREKADGGEHWLKIFDEDGNHPYQTGDLNTLFAFGS